MIESTIFTITKEYTANRMRQHINLIESIEALGIQNSN